METISEQKLLKEINAKQARVAELMQSTGLAALLLRRRENVAWLTAGQSSRTVATPSEVAIASLVLLLDGRRFYLAANNESQRLADEDFHGLGFEPVVYPWQEDALESAIHRISGAGSLGSDIPHVGYETIDISPLRSPLLPPEIARYRELCGQTASAVADVLLDLEPGADIREMEARVCYKLHRSGVEPTVLLMAADERVRKYKHALTQDAKIRHLAMINLCARRWGLAVSMTRYVHFGPMPAELEKKFAVSQCVYAALLHATREGATSAELFGVARREYVELGFSGEEAEHHQGGAAGYLEREWLARPLGSEVVRSPQAFAWNPSVQGAKVEDTILLKGGEMEVMTRTPSLPEITMEVGGKAYRCAGVLRR